ncbi:MAG TPA: hypothetical protein VJ865_05545, partial [Gemmatimonadaceae bacterium]|nr:hypothetical protein [Gemmatimonadaceae bacterium]
RQKATLTNPHTSPPAAPATPPASPQPAVATLSRELSDFLVELSITLNKHAIYPQNHPLLDVAVDGVANRLGMLFVGDRDSLSIGVARRQLIIEGVATDPLNPVLKELAQRLHQHHVGALKFTRGITRDELAAALAALSIDPTRAEKPIGHDTERLADLWQHVRFFPLTYDRLQLIEDEPGETPSMDKMLAGRATQLWIGLARAALYSDVTDSEKKKTDADDDTALEPATVARAIDEHQREEAYDQVIVGYLLQIGEELKTAEGPEAAGLQRRVSHLVGSLKQSTLERLLEMGGDKVQRRRFLLDASQGITVDAVLDLVKAASSAEGQTVSHSMLRMLSKLAHHPSAHAAGLRGRTDPTLRDVMRRLIDDWSLDDPNPEAYRQALENMSSLKNLSDKAGNGAHATDVEPERMIQIAIEIGAMGPQVHMAMEGLARAGRIETLLDLVERGPSAGASAPVWDFLVEEGVFDSLLSHQRFDMPLITRFAKKLGAAAAPPLLGAVTRIEEAKTRGQFYDLLQTLPDVGLRVAECLPQASPAVQRELLALLGKLDTLPSGFSPHSYLESEEPLVRREAVRLLLKNPSERDETIVSALSDPDDRVVFAGLSAAQEKCPPLGINLIKQRVDRGELDSQLRTMGIRIVAQRKTPDALDWLMPYVMTETNWARRPKLRPSSPEMLAALSMIASHWRNDPATETVLKLAAQSRDPEVRAKLARTRASTATPEHHHE